MAATLVADDESNIRDVVQDALERDGRRVVSAKDGAEALAKAAQHRGDLLVKAISLRVKPPTAPPGPEAPERTLRHGDVALNLPRHGTQALRTSRPRFEGGAMRRGADRAVWVALLVACSGGGAGCGAPVAKFTDLTARFALPTGGHGCTGFRDFDHDGRPDLIVATDDGHTATLHLFRNTGAAFEDHALPLGEPLMRNCAAGDYDGDGFTDLLLSMHFPKNRALILLRNTGTTGFEFEDRTSLLPALGETDFGAVGFFDADGDGRLDLFLGTFAAIHGARCHATADDYACDLPKDLPRPSSPFVLLARNGGFETHRLVGDGRINGAQFLDWDGDGDTDVFASVDFGRNLLFRNDGGGSFTESWPENARLNNNGMGGAFADYDGDGTWDAYLADLGPDQLWFGGPDGKLRNLARERGVFDATQFHSGWSPMAEDFDNDGDQDVYVVNSGVATDASGLRVIGDGAMVDTPQHDFLFWNDGGSFTVDHVARAQPFGVVELAAGGAGDFDGDGRLDVATVVSAWWLGTNEFRLLHNEGAAGHWLGVRLVGRAPNTQGLGAVVTLTVGGRAQKRTSGLGGVGISSEVLHFGLGDATKADSLEVRWPGGVVQHVPGPLAADRVIDATQP